MEGAFPEFRIRSSIYSSTIQLLLDVYGNVEPMNREMMEKIKDQLLGGVGRLTSAQFAALINSYGSAQKNLDEALRLFDALRTLATVPTFSELKTSRGEL